jgi:hypothetical protein
MDMSRDIEERLTMFLRHHVATDLVGIHPKGDGEEHEKWVARVQKIALKSSSYMSPMTLNRIALNMDQIEEYTPPPNPAKLTDVRAKKYIKQYGDESWELDALEPSVITRLIEQHVANLRDDDLYVKAEGIEVRSKRLLSGVAKHWDRVVEVLK